MTRFSRKVSFGLWGLLSALSALAVDAAEELPSILDLQRSHVEANGGLANIQALTSLMTVGVITNAEGDAFDFKLYKKRPGLMRMQIDFPNGALQKIFNGSRGFEVFSSRGVEDRVEEMDAAESAKMNADSAIDGPFFSLRSRPEWLRVVAEVEVGGLPAYEIEVDAAADSPYERIWLDKEHYQEVKLRRRLLAADGSAQFEAIYFSEFEQVNGVWFAKLSRYEREGRLLQSIRIERVRANMGLFDSLFQRPKP